MENLPWIVRVEKVVSRSWWNWISIDKILSGMKFGRGKYIGLKSHWMFLMIWLTRKESLSKFEGPCMKSQIGPILSQLSFYKLILMLDLSFHTRILLRIWHTFPKSIGKQDQIFLEIVKLGYIYLISRKFILA